MASPGTECRVGIVTSGEVNEARRLEARGIDSLWVGGHLASTNPSPEAMVGLARLAAVTERVTIGTSILLLPLYPPAVIAKQVADLDRVTGGRVALGVGVGGEYPQEFRAVQVPIEERGRRTDEIIPLLREFWTADEVSWSGRHYDISAVRIHPAPVQVGGPPILVAGRKEAAMRRAASLGDGWFPYLYSPRRYADSVAAVAARAAEIGRDLAHFHWCAFVFVNIADDGDVARAEAAAAIGGSYRQDLSPMVDRVAAVGTSAEVLARLHEFHRAGVRHFVLMPATSTERRAAVVDQLLGDVIPALRAACVGP